RTVRRWMEDGAEIPGPAEHLLRAWTGLQRRAYPGIPTTPTPIRLLAALNIVLAREGWQAFYDEHGIGQLRHIATNTVPQIANPHRPLTPAELERKDQLTAYLGKCSEDELIEEVLRPMFRQLGFHRVTAIGHKAIRTRHWNTARTCG